MNRDSNQPLVLRSANLEALIKMIACKLSQPALQLSFPGIQYFKCDATLPFMRINVVISHKISLMEDNNIFDYRQSSIVFSLLPSLFLILHVVL